MQRVVPELDGVLVPAGSLDTPSPIPAHAYREVGGRATQDAKAEARIFCDSRAEWSCSDDLPVFAEYPPGV